MGPWKGTGAIFAIFDLNFGLFFKFRENAAPLRLGEKKIILPMKRAKFLILWSRLSGEGNARKWVERGSILAFFGHFWPF